MAGRMNASERASLRQVVRSRCKVLRADVSARAAELTTEISEKVAAEFAGRDKRIGDMNEVIAGIIDQANKDIREQCTNLQKELGGVELVALHGGMIPGLIFSAQGRDKMRMRMRLEEQLHVQVTRALRTIESQEADLLQALAVDGLETDAARDFLGRIPTVGELVPTSRIMEIGQ